MALLIKFDKNKQAIAVSPAAREICSMTVRRLRDAPWLRVRLKSDPAYAHTARTLRQGGLHTVCEEALCPNRHECWSHGTATFMIMGDVCTRNCNFCNVSGGHRPLPLDADEPLRLAHAAARMNLHYVVLTSVTRDDLPDGGAEHFGQTVDALREALPTAGIELLTPDFHRCEEQALETLSQRGPLIWGHNLETVPRLYASARTGADYARSLRLLERIAKIGSGIEAKSALMLGLGESREEIRAVLKDLLAVGCRRLAVGQYLRPTSKHLPVEEYLKPETFAEIEDEARTMGFTGVRAGPLVRSSYLADLASGETVINETVANKAREE